VIDPCKSKLQVPWCLQGAFLMALVGGHIQASLLHGGLDVKLRLETAMTGALCERVLASDWGLRGFVTTLNDGFGS
jgi:hypothetical protein